MKNLIASLAFLAIYCGASAQTKKPDSTSKPIPAGTNRSSHLVQEKIWPASNSKDGKVIISHPIAQTRNKL
jgi:hypothetical protein